jgi:flagellar basal body rod protein FlgG
LEHIMGDSVSATKPETTTAPASASANSANRRPVRPGVKASGAYTAARVSVMATTAKPISLALDGGGEGLHAFFDVAVDVLQHHDGVVHHQADGQHQRQQGEGVDGEAEQRHQRKRNRSG